MTQPTSDPTRVPIEQRAAATTFNEGRTTDRQWAELLANEVVSKHLIDVDDPLLSAARAELDTTTIKDTVNEALRRATSERSDRIQQALDVLAGADLEDRADAWR